MVCVVLMPLSEAINLFYSVLSTLFDGVFTVLCCILQYFMV